MKYLNESIAKAARINSEVLSAAKWCAQRGIKGYPGDALPENLSDAAHHRINSDLVAFGYAILQESERD